jgi:hypothetical protein
MHKNYLKYFSCVKKSGYIVWVFLLQLLLLQKGIVIAGSVAKTKATIGRVKTFNIFNISPAHSHEEITYEKPTTRYSPCRCLSRHSFLNSFIRYNLFFLQEKTYLNKVSLLSNNNYLLHIYPFHYFW